MNFQNPIPRATPPRFSELSTLASLRESQSNAKAWKKNQRNTSQIGGSTQALQRMQRQISATRGRMLAPTPWIPFQIYNYPAGLRKFQNDDDWRRVKVRMGWIYGDGGNVLSVDGCDYNGNPLIENTAPILHVTATSDTYFNYPSFGDAWQGQLPPDDDSAILINDGVSRWNEIVVPDDGSSIYIWICACYDINAGDNLTVTDEPFIAYGALPGDFEAIDATSLATGIDFTDIWPNWYYSRNDPYHVMVGRCWVSDNKLNISQQLYDNPTLPIEAGAFTGTNEFEAQAQRFRGEYDATTYYFSGDSVCMTDSEWRSVYLLRPPSATYGYGNGPVYGIQPSTNTPDPWFLLSRSPLTGATFQTGAYDASKYYLRHS